MLDFYPTANISNLLGVTFLTTDDAKALNDQMSNLVAAIQELTKQIMSRDNYERAFEELEHEKRILEKEQRRLYLAKQRFSSLSKKTKT